jgi:RNA polymerase sigma-70 factor, ECF subfamily
MHDTSTAVTELLVSEAQAGNRRALEALFARYLPRVRRLVALRLGYTENDFMNLEDLVQEALLDVFRNLQKFEERSEARFCNWLAVCVANTVKERSRRGRARKRSSALPFVPLSDEDFAGSVLAGEGDSPSLLAEGAELAERIDSILVGMGDEARESIILSRVCGMSHVEIAHALGLPTDAAARKLLSRALAALRQELER